MYMIQVPGNVVVNVLVGFSSDSKWVPLICIGRLFILLVLRVNNSSTYILQLLCMYNYMYVQKQLNVQIIINFCKHTEEVNTIVLKFFCPMMSCLHLQLHEIVSMQFSASMCFV